MISSDIVLFAGDIAPLYREEGGVRGLVMLAAEKLSDHSEKHPGNMRGLIKEFLFTLQLAIQPPPGSEYFSLYDFLGSELGVEGLMDEAEASLKQGVDRVAKEFEISRDEAKRMLADFAEQGVVMIPP